MNVLSKSNTMKGQFIFFMLWPFGSMLYSVYDFRNTFSKNIIWLFTIFYGLTIVIAAEGKDAYIYIQEFQRIAQQEISLDDLLSSYFKSSGALDIYKSLLMWIVSRFTDNYRIFYACVAIVYGFFFSRNLWFVLSKIEGTVNMTLLFFILAMAFMNPMHALQTIRFGTASQVFIYGILVLFIQGKKSGILWAASSILIHFSFILPVGMLIIYRLLPKKLPLFFLFFIITTFILELDLRQIRVLLINFMPDLLQPKVESYTNLKYAEGLFKSLESTNWYVQYKDILIKYLSYGLIIFIYFRSRDFFKVNTSYLDLFCFTLFIYGVANVISIVPSGYRFINLSLGFLYVTIIHYFDNIPSSSIIKLIRFISLPILILYTAVSMRFAIDTMGLMLFFGNPFLAMFVYESTPIIDYIKTIL